MRALKGDVVIRQGESGDVFYAVADGSFDIAMNDVYLRTAPRGDFFGEVALLANVTRTATVTATTDSQVLAIHRDPFLLAITGHETSHATATAYVVGLDTFEANVTDRNTIKHESLQLTHPAPDDSVLWENPHLCHTLCRVPHPVVQDRRQRTAAPPCQFAVVAEIERPDVPEAP